MRLYETSLYVLQVCPQHFPDDFHIAAEQKGVFRCEEIAALAAQIRDIDAAAADAEPSVFHNHALAAGGGKGVVD